MKFLILLGIVLLATFGAGTVDVLFPDVVPLRPYTGVFQTVHAPTLDSVTKTVLPPVPMMLILSVIVATVISIFFPHLIPSLSLVPVPLGSRQTQRESKRLLGNKAAKNARLPLAEAIAGSSDLDRRINKRFKGRYLKGRGREA